MEQHSLKTVHIIGRGIGSEDVPQEIGPDEEKWGVNIVIMRHKVDVGFDMHDDMKMTDIQIQRRREIIPYAHAMEIPVYSVHAIPNTTYMRYPIELIIKRFNTGFFTNAICYMMALALYREVEQIKLWGVVHLRAHTEYATQKPGVDYWLGVANGMGVETYIHGEYCEIGQTHDRLAYGYKITTQEMINKYGQLP